MKTCYDYPEKKFATGLLVALSMLFCAGGCAPPFSQATLDQVDRSITLTELRSDPYRYKGKWVMLAGVIVSARNAQGGTFIEVLQRPTGRRGQPLDTDATEGGGIHHLHGASSGLCREGGQDAFGLWQGEYAAQPCAALGGSAVGDQ